MKTKYYKVYQGFGRNYVDVPKIVMQGKWLSDLGYSIGDPLAVTISEGQITIRKAADTHDGGTVEKEGNVCVG